MDSCVVCIQRLKRGGHIQLLCGHSYCHQCLRNLFMQALTFEAKFPPKCCQRRITPTVAGSALTSELRGLYHEKEVEYSTVNRVYCCAPTCSAFIPPKHIQGRSAACPKCAMSTCASCKQTFHGHNTPCPRDRARESVMNVANAEGWKSCPRCHAVVEHAEGCVHMTCHCGHQFCYRCGENWPCQCMRADPREIAVEQNLWGWHDHLENPFVFDF